MDNVVKIFNKTKSYTFTLEEIEEKVPLLRKLIEKYHKDEDKLVKLLSECHPKSPERRHFLEKAKLLDESFKNTIQGLGGRVNNRNRIRFSGKECFYIYDFTVNDIDRIPYD